VFIKIFYSQRKEDMNRGITVFGPEMHCIFDAAVCGQDPEFVPDLEGTEKIQVRAGSKGKGNSFSPRQYLRMIHD